MSASGLTEESDQRPDSADDERRRYYRIKNLGKRVVRAEAERLSSALAAARAKRVLGKALMVEGSL